MRALIVYESIFGSTRQIAEAIGEGLKAEADVQVTGVADQQTAQLVLDDFDLVLVGGPTQGWSMSWPSTRRAAPMRVQRPGSGLMLEPGASTEGGVREWLASIGSLHTKGAAFDTRINGPVLLTGRASKGIARQLSRHGLLVVAPPESFLVDKGSHLLPGELERARIGGHALATLVDHRQRGEHPDPRCAVDRPVRRFRNPREPSTWTCCFKARNSLWFTLEQQGRRRGFRGDGALVPYALFRDSLRFQSHSGDLLDLGPIPVRLSPCSVIFETLVKSRFAKGTNPRHTSRVEQLSSRSMSSISGSSSRPGSPDLTIVCCIVAPFPAKAPLVLSYTARMMLDRVRSPLTTEREAKSSLRATLGPAHRCLEDTDQVGTAPIALPRQ